MEPIPVPVLDTSKQKVSPEKPVTRNLSDSESSSSEDGADYSPMYSSSLLQQFVEKTEILSAQCERLINGRARKIAPTGAAATETRVKKPRAPKPARVPDAPLPAPRAMPELEAYRLDCAQSNVSPDSGIQSVPGSPVNEGAHTDSSTPPVLRPISPPDKGLKKRPGRPKKFRNGRVKNSHMRKPDGQEKVEDRPPIHNLIPSRRGPGRPKKAPPVLEPSVSLSGRDETDSANLNIMLNEICERVNRRLELPSSKGGSRSIEIKELERIISDHKSSKARNSKIDAIFSKSKKLSNLPNIAIVKPMQHHILNERKDDDEKPNKRGGRRGKLEKFEEYLMLKPDAGDIENPDQTEKHRRERRKSERDKKCLVKPVFPVPNRSNRPNRSRSRLLSSGTDGSCDKSVDSDIKKPEVPRVTKSEKNRKDVKKVARAVCKAGDAKGTLPVKAPCAVNYVQPMPRKSVQKKRPKYLSIRHTLLHHKHKRKKNKKHKRNEKENLDRAWFLKELEKVITDLQKFSIDGKRNLPTAPVAPTQVAPAPPPLPPPAPAPAPVLTDMAFPTEPRYVLLNEN